MPPGRVKVRFQPPLLVAAPLVAIVTAGLVALGVWQLARHGYKSDIESQRADRIAATPLSLGDTAALAPEEMDYRRVTLDGRWDHGHTLTIASRIRFGIRGEEVVMPLLPEDGGAAILVNRGWYPLTERERVLASLAIEAEASVGGLARYVANGNARQLASGAWTGFDVLSMAASLPYSAQPWGVIEGELLAREPVTPAAELPAQGFTGYENTVPHLEYALTWFGLAVALLVTAYLRLLRPRGGSD
jgi:surfeit locus 1 family protein